MMLDEDNKPFDLRDKFALEMLSLILKLSKKPLDLYRHYRDYLYYSSSFKEDMDNVNTMVTRDIEYSDKEFTKYVRQAYRMANIIRKVRLSAFE